MMRIVMFTRIVDGRPNLERNFRGRQLRRILCVELGVHNNFSLVNKASRVSVQLLSRPKRKDRNSSLQ